MIVEDLSYYNEFKSKMNHEIKKVRVSALDDLEKHIGSDISKLCASESENYVTLLVKLSKDNAEACREKSVKLITTYVNECTSVDDETFVSILLLVSDRLGKDSLNESSEEIRCLLVRLLIILISKNYNFTDVYVKSIVNVLINSLNDTCPEVKKSAFELIVIATEKFPVIMLEYSEKITKSLIICTKHKHFRIRSSAVTSLKIILKYCDKDIIREVCGSLGECLLDGNVHVRIAVLRAAAFWVQELPNKYSYTCYILPLILSCLSDESEECQKEAYDLWDKIGLMYMKDNEEKIKEKVDYLPKEVFKLNDNDNVPNYGCHALVCSEVSRFLETIVAELDDWRKEVRIRSSELLKITIVHARSSITPFLDILIPALLKKCIDEETTISKNIIETAEFMGKVIPAKIYWKLIEIHVKDHCTLNHLILLSSLLKFSKDFEVVEIVNDVASVFVEQQIFEISEATVRERVVEIFSKLLNCCGNDKLITEISFKIYLTLLAVMFEAEDEMRLKTLGLIDVLCKVSEFQTRSELNHYSFRILFKQFLETCPLWQSHSIDFKLFIVAISEFSEDVFNNVADEFIRISEIVLQPSFDKEVSFNLILTIAKLIENGDLNLNKNIHLMEKFILGPLKRQLIWRSGKVAEVIRNSALIIFNLYLERVIIPNFSLIYELLPLLISLSEDNYEDTRIASLCAFPSCSRLIQSEPFSLKFFIKILTAAIKRLEDTNNRVRILAGSKIAEIVEFAPNINKDSNDGGFIEDLKTFELLFVMSCDGNVEVRKAVRDTLKKSTTMNFLKQIFLKETLNVLIDKCRDEELSANLKKSLII